MPIATNTKPLKKGTRLFLYRKPKDKDDKPKKKQTTAELWVQIAAIVIKKL